MQYCLNHSRAKLAFGRLLGVILLVALAGAFSAGFGSADAQTLRERRLQEEQDQELDQEADFTNEICQSRISVSIDWPSFKARDGRLRGNYARDCDAALSAIERICRENGGRRQVKASIQRFRCGAGDRRRVVLNDGTLLYANAERGVNDHQYIYDYLRKKL